MPRFCISHRIWGIVAFSCLSFILTGCTPDEKTEALTVLQSALNSLVQNRALTEQFVRDVKANADPTDPAYAQVMDSYQDARDSYHHFLDDIESGKNTVRSRSIRDMGPIDVQNATADFLADATSILKPNLNTRRIPFQRAVIIPDNLKATINCLPKRAREKMIDQFDHEVRWKSWGQL